ncbi:MAG: RHS repeat-associated core domain-containing protein, partial [Acidimicrobiales bacterium]
SALRTATDPLTNTTRTFTWNDGGDLTDVAYGTSAATRHYIYDDAGRLTEDALKNAASQTTEREVYGYDPDDNLTSQLVELAANAAAGQNSYGYDDAGRLASWTKPDTTVVTYGWDDAGNRTTAGADTYAYDARNRIANGPDGTYTWSPRGTLTSVANGAATTNNTFDALGRLTNYNDQAAYTYDGLDRIAHRGTATFAYAGTEIDPVADGTSLYPRSPSGDLVALADASGANAHLAGRNRHGDLTHLFDTDGALDATKQYDPFGTVTVTTGASTTIGFQADWTDPDSGKTWMGARWYDAEDAGFASRDTIGGGLDNPIGLNRYTYAFADPLQYFDADGHWPSFVNKAVKTVGSIAKSTTRAVASRLQPLVKTASAVVSSTISTQVARVQQKVASTRTAVASRVRAVGKAPGAAIRKVTNAEIGGATVRDWAGAIGSKQTALDAGRSFSNFSAGFVDEGTSLVTFGKLHTNFGTMYDDDPNVAGAYGFGRATAQIENAIAAAYGGAQLGRSAVGAVSAVRAAGGFAEAAGLARAAAGARVARATTSLKSVLTSGDEVGAINFSSIGRSLRGAKSAGGLRAAEGGSEVLLDTSAVKAQSAARSLMKPGECAVICSTVEREAAQQGFSTAGLPVIEDGTSAVLRSQVATQLRGFGAAAQGLENDAIIGATALERGIPLITGDRALWNAVLKLGGDARWFAPGM